MFDSKKKKPGGKSTAQNNPMIFLCSGICGVVACGGSLLLFARLLSAGKLPLYAADPLSTGSLCIGAAVFCTVLGNRLNRHLLPLCLIPVLTVGLSCTLAGYFLYDSGIGPASVIRIFSMVLSAFIGCSVGCMAQKQKRNRPRK